MGIGKFFSKILTRIRRKYYYKLIKSNPIFAIKILYYKNTGKRLNFENLETYNEKLQWIKVFEITELMKICADKLDMRRFIKIIGLDEILPRLYATYNSSDEINFAELPKRFVLKLNHGWSYNFLIEDKDNLDLEKVRNQINIWQYEKFGCLTGETQYFDIVPKIICEEYLGDSLEEILDYKVLCFNGQPILIQVDKTRFSDHRRDFYDIYWNRLDIRYGYDFLNTPLKRPTQLEELLTISRKISKFFKHVRIDFYIVKKRIYIGELTFTPTAGYKEFFPAEYNFILGNLINTEGEK